MKLIPEETLGETMRDVVAPYLQALCTKGMLKGELYYELFALPESKGTVVISHGFTESCVKFHELIYYLLQSGYDCAMVEHRGHGHSQRMGREKNVVHIASFGQYVTDFHDFVHEAVLPWAKKGPLYLYGHSMGGCIAARYLEEYPGEFDKAVLNAPMLGLQTGGLPEWAAIALCNVQIAFKRADRRLFFQADFDPHAAFEKDCATSRARFDFYHALRLDDPGLQTAAASYSWAKESILAGRQARADAGKIQIPLLLLQADNDTLVSYEAQEEFIKHVPNGRLVRIADSKHEIYRSENAVLEKYWDLLLSFLG